MPGKLCKLATVIKRVFPWVGCVEGGYSSNSNKTQRDSLGLLPSTKVGFTPRLFPEILQRWLLSELRMTEWLPQNQLPCFQHVIILGKGGPVFLLLLSQCWGLDVKCPPPKASLLRAWLWCLSSKNISPLWTLLFLNLFSSFWLPQPTLCHLYLLFLAIMRWVAVPYNVFPAMIFCLCLNSASMEPVWWVKETHPYVVFSSFLLLQEKAD